MTWPVGHITYISATDDDNVTPVQSNRPHDHVNDVTDESDEATDDDEIDRRPTNKWMRDKDSYNMKAFDQIDGVWPIVHPLPLPKWATRSMEPYIFKKIWQYEDLNAMVEATLHRMLEETHYDTVNNFCEFHSAYTTAKETITGPMTLKMFFHQYRPPINRRHHMCVSLAMEIVTRIADVCPELAEHLFLVSCEEAVEATQPYIANCEHRGIENAMYSLEKEHSLIAMRITVDKRDGFMILDPGYHVARAVTVMKDQMYPHTGWFTQSDESHLKREYCYTLSQWSDGFIEWSERTTRSDKQTHEMSLVYVDRPYRTAVDVTVRRNLVYNFRSLLSRDAKGRVCAGLYFPVSRNINDCQITIFYDGPNNGSVKVKQKFSIFRDLTKLPDTMVGHLKQLAHQLRYDYDHLIGLISNLCDAMFDQDFVQQLLSINEDVTVMSADN